MSKVDVIIFGATGFTGMRIIPYINDLAKNNKVPLTWAVAARSQTKLKVTLDTLEKETGTSFNNVDQIIADVNDEESIRAMTARGRIVINATGPYRFYGETIVKACLDTGTHYVDVSGEPQFMEAIQLRYHETALNKGVYLISACGFDSIPADLGLVYLQNKFKGIVNSVETYLYADINGGPYEGSSGNYTTWECAVHGMSSVEELKAVRRKLFPNPLPKTTPKLPNRGEFFYSDIIQKWCIPFIGADRSVMLRSQRFFYENENKRPVQVATYLGVKSFYVFLLFVFYGLIFNFFCKFSYTRNLLLKHPKFFSNGLFDKKGPPQKKQENTYFYTLFFAEGWSDGTLPDDGVPPNKKMTAKVSGVNPGYGLTCVIAVLSAFTVLLETDKLPNKGGCYPPGAAFAKTSLIEKLNKHGLNFEIVTEGPV